MIFDKYCPEGVFVNIVILLLIFAILRRIFVLKRTTSPVYLNIASFLFVAFCFYSFYDTDYYHYKEWIEKMGKKILFSNHLEDIYIWLVKSINYSYELFRLIVWGCAALFLFKTFKILKLDLGVGMYIFSMIFLLIFGYARVSLGMSIAFFGFSILVSRHYFNEKIIGVIIIALSMFFHKSMFFMAPIFILSLTKFNRRMLALSLIAFAIAVYIGISYGLMSFIEGTNSDFINSESAGRYAASAEHVKGIGSFLKTTLYRAVYYLTPILIGYIIIKRDYKALPDYIKRFMNCAALIVLAASIFLFDLGANTDIIYIRLLYFAMIPIAISLTYIYCSMPKYSKYAAIIIFIGMMASIYDLSYKFYLAFHT